MEMVNMHAYQLFGRSSMYHKHFGAKTCWMIYLYEPIIYLDILTEFDFLPNCERFPYNILQRVRHAKRGHLLLRTPGPVSFGTCICSNC